MMGKVGTKIMPESCQEDWAPSGEGRGQGLVAVFHALEL